MQRVSLSSTGNKGKMQLRHFHIIWSDSEATQIQHQCKLSASGITPDPYKLCVCFKPCVCYQKLYNKLWSKVNLSMKTSVWSKAPKEILGLLGLLKYMSYRNPGLGHLLIWQYNTKLYLINMNSCHWKKIRDLSTILQLWDSSLCKFLTLSGFERTYSLAKWMNITENWSGTIVTQPLPDQIQEHAHV